MLIETYKGVQIHHNGHTDEFYTDIVINTTHSGKKEFIKNGRLQKTRELLDKFLNTASKKPIIQKAWLNEGDEYILVDVILFNKISGCFMFKRSEKDRPEELGKKAYRGQQLFIKSKENDAIISELKKKQSEISKIEKAVSCSSGKLIPLSEEYTD